MSWGASTRTELQSALDLGFIGRRWNSVVTKIPRQDVHVVMAVPEFFHDIAAAEFITTDVMRWVEIGHDKNLHDTQWRST